MRALLAEYIDWLITQIMIIRGKENKTIEDYKLLGALMLELEEVKRGARNE